MIPYLTITLFISTALFRIPELRLITPGEISFKLSRYSHHQYHHEYMLDYFDGSRAFIRTEDSNCFRYFTKEGIQVMGTGPAYSSFSHRKSFLGGSGFSFNHSHLKFIPYKRHSSIEKDELNFNLYSTLKIQQVLKPFLMYLS